MRMTSIIRVSGHLTSFLHQRNIHSSTKIISWNRSYSSFSSLLFGSLNYKNIKFGQLFSRGIRIKASSSFDLLKQPKPMGLVIDESKKEYDGTIKNKEFSTATDGHQKKNVTVTPKKVLIISKTTRLQYELYRAKLDYSEVDNSLFKKRVKRYGTNFEQIKDKDKQQRDYIEAMKFEMEKEGIEVKVVTRRNYTKNLAVWSDLIISAGGDGTFLTAASKVRDKTPVIGMNTDPIGSEGHLCLTGKQRRSPREVIRHFLDGEYEPTFRQRIRVTILKPGFEESPPPTYKRQRRRSEASRAVYLFSDDESEEAEPPVEPMLALNEVFIGESHAARVSYYDVQIDDGPMLKQKSSGMIACTGTGSTSWNYNGNRLTSQTVKEIMDVMGELGFQTESNIDEKTVDEICHRFNAKLIFDPTAPRMAFTVRDPVFNATFPKTFARGFANRIRVKSRCTHAHLVLDGSTSVPFNQGTEVILELIPEDALQTFKH
jgi:NAD+ kinase